MPYNSNNKTKYKSWTYTDPDLNKELTVPLSKKREQLAAI